MTTTLTEPSPLTAPPRHDLAERLIVFAIVALAAGLRLYGLASQSVWYDEAMTARLAQYPLGDVAWEVQRMEQIPPLYHYFMHFWIGRFGDSASALRFPSTLFSVLTVWLIYKLGRTLFDWQSGAAAAFILAVSPYQRAYAQEARPYALYALETVLAIWGMHELLRNGGWRWQLAFVLINAALLWTHLFGCFVLLAEYVCWFTMMIRRTPRPISTDRLLNLTTLSLLLFSPWAFAVFVWIHEVSHVFWIGRFGLAMIPHAYAVYSGSLMAATVVCGVAILGAIWQWRRGDRNRTVLLLSLATLPVVIPVLISILRRPVFVHRYGMPATVAIALLAGVGFYRAIRPLAVRTIVAVLFLATTALAWQSPDDPTIKPDWRDAVSQLVKWVHPGDVIQVNANYAEIVFDYYAPPDLSHTVDIRRRELTIPPATEEPPGTRLWIITLRMPSMDNDATLNGWRFHQRWNWDEVILEQYDQAR